MKKLVLSLLTVAALSTPALAQSTPVKFGLKAGLAFPNMTFSAGSASFSYGTKTSYYVGGTVEFQLSDLVSIQPGLTFIDKGTKINSSSFGFDNDDFLTDVNATINFKYLEVPVNALVNFKVANSGKLFVGAGPYFAYALSANAKMGSEKEKIEFEDSGFKRTDFGLNFLAGFQLNNGLNVHAGYGLGLSNMANDEEAQDFDASIKNKVFTVGLGFSF
ncbi:PorT family protein [Pedobacter sp. HDW13]|uniref:porin family protein n=1 Tax=Pedobacter sp. HDW13 TaxID=2714940 RepID=UPI0014090912|nr:porin family protein [Pedobacter sp. HDW13]QIL40920.1 PorT family protein [Pedobacter sp. HDW13]